MPCSFRYERAARLQGISRVAGVDEAGRGPLAGPVVAAAVVFVELRAPRGLNDSKRLSPEARADYYAQLTAEAHICWAVSVQPVEVIDRLNILRASHLAMEQALAALDPAVEHALVDGLPIPNFPMPHTALVHGDARSFSIAAASVIAKVTRDRLMDEYDERFPEYGFRRHKGYGTPDHLARLRAHGPCPIHRRSFSPVAQPDLPGLAGTPAPEKSEHAANQPAKPATS